MKIIRNKILLVLFLSFSSAILFAQKKTKTSNASKATPCMDVLPLFTAPNVPAMAPQEEFAPLVPSIEPTPENLPGNGLAQHPMLYVGENCNRMSLVKDGKVIWTYSTGKGWEYDDVWMLSNGNVLFSRMQYVALITPDKKVLWRYDCDTSKGAGHTEKCINLPTHRVRIKLCLC